MRLGAEESENTYLFTLKHDRSLARGCGGQGGESVSAALGGFEPEMQEERLCPSSRVLVSHIQKKGGSEAKMDTSRSPHPETSLDIQKFHRSVSKEECSPKNR